MFIHGTAGGYAATFWGKRLPYSSGSKSEGTDQLAAETAKNWRGRIRLMAMAQGTISASFSTLASGAKITIFLYLIVV